MQSQSHISQSQKLNTCNQKFAVVSCLWQAHVLLIIHTFIYMYMYVYIYIYIYMARIQQMALDHNVHVCTVYTVGIHMYMYMCICTMHIVGTTYICMRNLKCMYRMHIAYSGIFWQEQFFFLCMWPQSHQKISFCIRLFTTPSSSSLLYMGLIRFKRHSEG